MNGNFREALDNATGQSESVIVVFVDIRGFSAFSKNRDSHDIALYIKRVYMQLIDEYFPYATFHIPTGDGLLIVVSYDGKTLPDKCKEVIQSCLLCHKEFADICKGDHMINFDVPKRIGIGVSRGTVCCLKSGNKILDYSGHRLNLASRLMNLARPAGIVIDGDFGFDLLSEDEQKLFGEAEVYLRSIAEDTPVTVYILKDVVSIPPENMQPLAEERWSVQEDELTGEMRKSLIEEWLTIYLKEPLKRPGALRVFCHHHSIDEGKPLPLLTTTHELYKSEYGKKQGRPYVDINIEELKSYLKSRDVPPDMKVKIVIEYVPKPR